MLQKVTEMKTGILAAAAVAVAAVVGISGWPPSAPASASYIVQADSLDAARGMVHAVGGEITHELGIINAVAATLDSDDVATLRRNPALRKLHENGTVETAGKGGGKGKSGTTSSSGNYTVVDTHVARRVNAHVLHGMGITGDGVGIAVLDTGLWKHDGIRYDASGAGRIAAVYDAITNTEVSANSGDDPAGHGSHVASLAVSSLMTATGQYNGIAPDASLISVRAFDENGNGSYADVIRAIEWIVANRSRYKIRILNASFTAQPRSHYWDDPINQAIMVAWQNEVFVVAAAGNSGPDPMTIGVPGNVPYVMTVGAMTDNFTPEDDTDDRLASFSSAGPTVEGFVKPDVVAPGGHAMGLVQGNSSLALAYPEYYASDMYFQMSGTSQATAVVSGVAALILQAEAWHGVDALKCKIMAAAWPAVSGNGQKAALAYSVFQQGAGLVDAVGALQNSRTDCANVGLHIDNDIDGFQHFGGPANQDLAGNYYLRGDLDSKEAGYVWDGNYGDSSGYLFTKGYLWTDEYAWSNGYLWTDGVGVNGYLWTDDGTAWINGYLWSDEDVGINGYLWTDTEMASINSWVPQE